MGDALDTLQHRVDHWQTFAATAAQTATNALGTVIGGGILALITGVAGVLGDWTTTVRVAAGVLTIVAAIIGLVLTCEGCSAEGLRFTA